MQPPAPPAVAPSKPLQADAEGHYVPGYSFSVGRLRFTGFTLRPEAFVTFAEPNARFPAEVACQTATISATAIHLRCDDPQIGVVTINGKFRTRVATNRLDTPVISAVVTVRSGSGEVLYSAQDSFVWEQSR